MSTTPNSGNSGEDWRLQGQERYLQGATLHRRKWVEARPGWDHDHCEFCGDKFPLDHAEGYTTNDQYRWVCGTCFDDFRERFQWQLGL